MAEKLQTCPFRVYKQKRKYDGYEAEYFMPCIREECPAFYTAFVTPVGDTKKVAVEKCKRLA